MQSNYNTYALCTLFDHNYLDKGLVLYDSLMACCENFVLYVLAMSDRCYEVINDMQLPNIVSIRLSDFEDEELLRVKSKRGVGEYCWTCTPSLLLYVLRNYSPDYCTYVDSDIYFYADPHIIIEEMQRKNASVQIIGHRFSSNAADKERCVGKYCVEFDTFKNDEEALRLLTIWRNQCIERCSLDGDGIHWGDQKYQDHWCEDYNFVIETSNMGMGVAPWNIASYKLYSTNDKLQVSKDDAPYDLVFYHFENIQYIDYDHVNLNVFLEKGVQSKLVKHLYIPYLNAIRDKKQFLKDHYSIDVLIKKHLGVNHASEPLVKNKKSLFKYVNPKLWYNYFFKKLPHQMLLKKNYITF